MNKHTEKGIEEVKSLIEKKATDFKQHSIELLDAFWDSENSIDFFSNDTKLENYKVRHISIVNGNLEVDLLEDVGEDGYGSLLIVFGDLIANRAIIVGEVIVMGSMKIEEIVMFENSSGDYLLSVGKDLIAKNYIEEEDNTDGIKGGFIVENKFPNDNSTEILIPECTEYDGEYTFLKTEIIKERIKNKLPVFIK